MILDPLTGLYPDAPAPTLVKAEIYIYTPPPPPPAVDLSFYEALAAGGGGGGGGGGSGSAQCTLIYEGGDSNAGSLYIVACYAPSWGWSYYR